MKKKMLSQFVFGALVISGLSTSTFAGKPGETPAAAAAAGADSSLSTSHTSGSSSSSSQSSSQSQSVLHIEDLMDEVMINIFSHLDPSSRAKAACVNWRFNSIAGDAIVRGEVQKREINKWIGNMVTLPEVTEDDVKYLKAKGIKTSIKAPIPSHKQSEIKAPIGLYLAVYGKYPDLSELITLSEADRSSILAAWKKDPSLPIVGLTGIQEKALVEKAAQLTGRKLYIADNASSEYLIRGRDQDKDNQITTTEFYFGDDEEEVKNHAWIDTNSGGHTHSVYSHPEGAKPNSFGIYPLGNAYTRSSDGVIRGGAFHRNTTSALSSNFSAGYAYSRSPGITFRVAEKL